MHSDRWDKVSQILLVIGYVALLGLVVFMLAKPDKKNNIIESSSSNAQEAEATELTRLVAYTYINKDLGEEGLVGDTGQEYELWIGDKQGRKDLVFCTDTLGNEPIEIQNNYLKDYEALAEGQKVNLTPDEKWEYPYKNIVSSDDSMKCYNSTKLEAERYQKGLLGQKYILLELLQTEKGFKSIFLSPTADYILVFDYSDNKATEVYGTQCSSILYQYNISDKEGYRIQ